MNNQINRKDLMNAVLKQNISTVEIKEITMPPGQSAPKHLHPCPVVGYVSSGSVLFQIEGEESKIICQGEAFYEPKDTIILHFDNASQVESLTFITFYLKEGGEENIQIAK